MEPLCRDIFGVHGERGEIVQASDVDHIIPKAQGGSDRHDNLRSLCHSCHSRRTAQPDGSGVGGIKKFPAVKR